MNKLQRIAKKPMPIEQWGDATGLKEELETHLEYGGPENIVRHALNTFREYIRDN